MDRFVFVALLCVGWASADSWNYKRGDPHGPANWTGLCKTGKKQSPIDITGATHDENLVKFNLVNYDKKAIENFTAHNDGHGFKIAFPEKVYNVSGGALANVYTTVQFHIHWGSNNLQGSEHTVSRKEFAAELHFVSYNTKYANISIALGKPDGLAVLGVLIEVGKDRNEAFSFLDATKDVTKPSKDGFVIEAFKFEPILPTDKKKYYRYSGSLTTPTCNEAVTWTVFRDPVEISQAQMNLLRSLKLSKGGAMVDNYRPVQQLYGRSIKASFVVPTAPPHSPTTATDDAPRVKKTVILLLPMLITSLFLH